MHKIIEFNKSIIMTTSDKINTHIEEIIESKEIKRSKKVFLILGYLIGMFLAVGTIYLVTSYFIWLALVHVFAITSFSVFRIFTLLVGIKLIINILK